MGDLVEVGSAIVTSIAAVVGVWVAWRGVSAWRSELRGRTEYDLARRILVGVYRVREGVRSVRSPLMSSAEYAQREGRDPKSEGTSAADLAYAYDRRFKAIRDAMDGLDVDFLEAEAVWGNLLATPAGELRQCVRELWVSITMYVNSHQTSPPWSERDRERVMKQVQPIIWPMGTPATPDYFGDRLTHAVESFDGLLKVHLRR